MACKLNLEQFLVQRKWKINPSPADGHCLLHSIITAVTNQVVSLQLNYDDLKSAIFEEALRNTDHYTFHLGRPSKQLYINEIVSYLFDKNYNLDFVDLVPYTGKNPPLPYSLRTNNHVIYTLVHTYSPLSSIMLIHSDLNRTVILENIRVEYIRISLSKIQKNTHSAISAPMIHFQLVEPHTSTPSPN